MPRSVVLKGAPRCPRCQLAPRWCICAGLRPVAVAPQVDVLVHRRELLRPSSTGHLLGRIVSGARLHEWRPAAPPRREDVVRPDRELWILHPQGEPPPPAADPAGLQVLLLDGSWVQATDMAHAVAPWGRRVGLPMKGDSRYWLRRQAGEGKFSTAETLLFLLDWLGLAAPAAELRAQFELHVWATLLSRGRKARAADYLVDSPVRGAFAGVVSQLQPGRG